MWQWHVLFPVSYLLLWGVPCRGALRGPVPPARLLWVAWCPLSCSDCSSAPPAWSPSPPLGGSWGGEFPTMHLLWYPTDSGAGVPPQRRGALALPPTPCLPPLPQLTPHPTEKRTHFVSHEYGMTVTRTLQEGGVRLRAGRVTSWEGTAPLACLTGAAQLRGCCPWGCRTASVAVP